MKLIIAGSRDITPHIEHLLAMLSKNGIVFPSEIVSGMSGGVDMSGKELAQHLRVPCQKFPADWKKWGKSAGPIRNRKMAEYADTLLAIWDGKSRGTKNMIDEMKNLNKKVVIQII